MHVGYSNSVLGCAPGQPFLAEEMIIRCSETFQLHNREQKKFNLESVQT